MRRLAAAAAAVSLVTAGCAGGGRRQVTVFAAASLASAFGAMQTPFADAHAGYSVSFSFAGSQQLAAQLAQGARADVVATADRASMTTALGAGGRPEPVTFARNRLVIAVRPGNPNGIAGLADLDRPDLRVVLAAPQVPAGSYARQALGLAHVAVHPVSLEDNVEGVVTKVALGEADAGLVYASDARSPSRGVQAVPIPDDLNVDADYLAAALPHANERRGGQAFVSFLLSPAGQAVLRRFGFLPPR